MGNIKEVLYNREVPKSMLNDRLTVELCENVHLHYRNLRLEFSKEEFLFLLKHLKTVDEKIVEEFEYGDDKFQSLVQTFELPESTEFNDRLQIEEQVEGHYHIHYRNLRMEITNLRELGYWEIPKRAGMDDDYHRDILSKFDIKEMKLEDRKIGDLVVEIYDDPKMIGSRVVHISESPCLRALNGNEAGYVEYIEHVKEQKRRKLGVIDNTHSLERFKATIASLDATGYVDCFIVVFGNLIGDGQHRAAWLYNKYGNDKIIKVINVIV